jgi:GT2 family glycosyltransferase
MPSASIVVPTRSRPGYLGVTLGSIVPQARSAGAEVIVVDDGGDAASREVAASHGVRYLAHPAPRGPNAARNTGMEVAASDLVVLVDDDVRAPEGWLAALLDAAAARPGDEVLGGPIRARLEGFRRHTCGREEAPITVLDLGGEDRDAEFVWSANMAVRRRALERVGRFDASLEIYGDEEDWQRRHRAAGGRIRYVAGAGLEHRRAPRDATLTALARGARRRGANSRRWDERKGSAPPLASELCVLAGCALHAVRFRCAFGVPMTAAAWGRVEAALGRRAAARRRAGAAPARGQSGGVPLLAGAAPAGGAPVPDVLSGSRGAPRRGRAIAADLALDGALLARAVPWRLDRAAARAPRRRVLALTVERPEVANHLPAVRRELARSRHDLTLRTAAAAGGGKFENLNALLAGHPAAGHDWLLLVDDDVELPRGFLDRFLFLAERFDLALAMPAHRHRSHAAWALTRRRPRSLVRETPWVEIGPVVALRADTWAQLLPFPPLRMGWGLDAHWAAIARANGWRAGIVDGTPVRHLLRPIATGYAAQAAAQEARTFLDGRPYLSSRESQRTVATHLTW